MKIKWILQILTNRSERYYGFRLTRTKDGRTIKGQISGGESNLLAAVGCQNNTWQQDYWWTTKIVPEKEIFALAYAGSASAEIWAWCQKEFKKRAKA